MSNGHWASSSPEDQLEKVNHREIDFVPQAIFRGSMAYFAEHLAQEIKRDSDDLGDFYGIFYWSPSIRQPVAIRHYAGHPEGTVSLYLPHEIEDVEAITQLLRCLMEELNLSSGDKIWERKDDPDF